MGAYEKRTWVQTTWILIRFWKVIVGLLAFIFVFVSLCFCQSVQYLTNGFQFYELPYCNRSQMTSWRAKNKNV